MTVTKGLVLSTLCLPYYFIITFFFFFKDKSLLWSQALCFPKAHLKMHSVFPTRSHNLSGRLKGAELREKRTQAKSIIQTAPHGMPWALLGQLARDSATNAFRFQSAFSPCFIGFHFFKM